MHLYMFSLLNLRIVCVYMYAPPACNDMIPGASALAGVAEGYEAPALQMVTEKSLS